ncbi:Crp/Fnr family transcriptional regulator [Caldimonas tepidiphila]|uniref:Crp/Fnr family transcriptional regulator n=1 Tax=Caldimonas tepidiphila TaxID=2315841 RepID=UPI000E5A4C33|nr:Crp/Fnr family transcriptional regulator [Caldimonas tepidiphila]
MNSVLDRPLVRPSGPAAHAATERSIPLDARTALVQAALSPVRVPRDAAHALALLATEHALPPNTPVFQRRETAQHLWLVASGQVALGTLNDGRMTQQTRLAEPGQWLDAASALLHGGHIEDAVTKGETLLWAFPLERLLPCVAAHPTLSHGLMTVLAGRVRDLTEGTLGLMQKDAEARCATWLLQHAELRRESAGHSTAVVEMRERKRSIASQLAITPETFSRVLRHLSDKDLIEVRGYTVRILDVEQLGRVAAS